MGWFSGDDKKKPEKVVKMKEDPKRAKVMRKSALEAARVVGKEVKETKKGVGRPEKETDKQRRERLAREKINKAARDGVIDNTITRKGKFKSEWD